MPQFQPQTIDFPFDNPAITDPFIIETDMHARLGSKFSSISTTTYRVTISLYEPPTQQEISDINTYMATGAIGLTVTCDKERIVANDTDTATIVCTSPLFASDTKVDYTVRFSGVIDGEEFENAVYGSGEADVEAPNVVTLTFTTDAVGDYTITIARKNGRHRGSVALQATEAI